VGGSGEGGGVGEQIYSWSLNVMETETSSGSVHVYLKLDKIQNRLKEGE